jgi:hypothetical protein
MKPPNDGIVIGHSVVNCGEMRNVIGGQAFARAESVSTNDFKMRTRFGPILKITARTKSYLRPKMRYFTKQLESQAKLSLFSGSHPCYFHYSICFLIQQ